MQESGDFIVDTFISQSKVDQKRRPMYPHFTTATDTDLVKHVFSCVADVILNEVLKTTGLQWSWSNITLDLMVFSTFDANYFESVPFNPVWIAFFPHCMTCLSYIIKKLKKKSSNCNGFVQFSWKLLWFDDFFWLKKIILPRFSEAYGVWKLPKMSHFVFFVFWHFPLMLVLF